jgi:hypothetical protein
LLLGLSATLPADVNLDSADLPALGGTGADAAFGTAAACSEPLAGAPNATLVVGAPFAAAAGHDAAGTVSIWSSVADTSAGPALVLTGDEAGAYFGTSVATGDLDADGFPELVVGAPGQDAPGVDGGVGGAVYVYAGTDLQEALGTGVAPQQVRTMRGEFSRGRFGNAIVVADLDADGTDDLFVGAPGTNRTGEVATTHAGEACGWWGPYTDWPEAAFSTDASVLLAADRQYLEVGEALATLDLDGDGALELAVRLRQPTRNKR